tara:strand:+ start:2383 stop:3828 length:1446 start_codon:yes stop_codon:yes gene_type:complete
MAIYKLFPEKDATLYTVNPLMNTGLDEILEASTYLFNSKAQTSRYLIKFSQNEINSVYTRYISGSGISYLSTEDNAFFSSIIQNPVNLVDIEYLNVPLTSSTGNGIGAIGNITVTSNTISNVTITNRGKNYKINNIIITPPLPQTNGLSTTASFTLSSLSFKKRSWNADLKNSAAVVTNLNSTSYLNIYPISQSWDMGTGRFGNTPITTNGCSWSSSTALKEWFAPNTTAADFSNKTTGSYSPLYGGQGGGTWYTGSTTGKTITASQTFTYANPIDLEVDVTKYVDVWFSQSYKLGGDIPNEGFIIKQPDNVEFVPSESFATTFRYYSVDTNTIYPPILEMKFDDFYYGTSPKMQTLPQSEAFISIYNNDGVYYSESVQRFRIAAIPQYPKKIFQTASGYLTNYYLPKQSFYAVKDSETNEYVIPFDTKYAKISADTTSSYFDIYMGGLEPERYYTILLKTKIGGTTKVFDEDMMFKVING